MKHIFAAFFISMCVLATPLSTYAVTADELLVQIDALLKLVVALQEKVRALGGTQTNPPQPLDTPASSLLKPVDYDICIKPPTRTLERGTQGSDVLALQEFLRDNASYDGELGGYFGELTEASVRRFQAEQKIASSGTPATTGFGAVGPKTRKAIALFCNRETPSILPSQTIVPTQTPGASGTPITQPAHCASGPALPPALCAPTHRAEAVYGSDSCHTGWMCKLQTTQTVTTSTPTNITPTQCGTEYAPVCAQLTLACTPGSACTQQEPTTFSNQCFMTLAQATFVSNGVCPATTPATTTVNRAPIIESVSGPTELAPNETGSWTITANDPDNDTLQYKILWGDESSAGGFSAINALAQSDSYSSARSYNHAYTLSSIYTLRAKAKDSKGLETEKTLTVRVGGGSGKCYSNTALYPEGASRSCITQPGGGGTMCAPAQFAYVCRSNEWVLQQTN